MHFAPCLYQMSWCLDLVVENCETIYIDMPRLFRAFPGMIEDHHEVFSYFICLKGETLLGSD